MKYNRISTLIFLAVLTVCLTIGGVIAYLTDTDTKTNTFTVGDVSLELQEPGWNEEDGKDLRPNKTLNKDPQIYNNGVNEEFVFMEVVIPYRNIITANLDGTKNEKQDTELYSYSINSGWMQLGSVKVDTDKQTKTYLYVYGTDTECTALEKNTKTSALFNQVTFANIVEDQGLEGETLEIVVNAYGIQTTDINGGKTSPADVWSVLSNQLIS